MAGRRARSEPAERGENLHAEHPAFGLEPSIFPTTEAVGSQYRCGGPAGPACLAVAESEYSGRGTGRRVEERDATCGKYPEQRGAQCYRVHRERRVRPTPAEPDIASRCDRSGRSETSSIANGWPGSPRPDARCVRQRRGERIVYRGLVRVSKAAEANGIYPCNSVRQR